MSKKVNNIIRQMNSLTADEQLSLATYLAELAKKKCSGLKPCYQWRDLEGIVKSHHLGIDVQNWVSKLREESENNRIKQN